MWAVGGCLQNSIEDDESETYRPSVMELGKLQRIKDMQGMGGGMHHGFGWSLIFLLVRAAC